MFESQILSWLVFLPILGALAMPLARNDRSAKILALAVFAYVVSPIDLMPGIALDDMALTVLALALIIKLTPRPVVLDLVQKAQSGGSPATTEESPPSDRGEEAQD